MIGSLPRETTSLSITIRRKLLKLCDGIVNRYPPAAFLSTVFTFLVAKLTMGLLFGPIRVTQTGFLTKSSLQVKGHIDHTWANFCCDAAYNASMI